MRGRDGLIRRAIVKYFNAEENDPTIGTYRARLTDLILIMIVAQCPPILVLLEMVVHHL